MLYGGEVMSLKDFIDSRREELEAAEQLQQISDKFPDLIQVWLADNPRRNGSGATGKAKKTRVSSGKSTVYETIAAMLVERHNKPIPTPEIVTETGLTRGSIGTILYKRFASKFISTSSTENEKVKMWQLTDVAYREAKQAAEG